MQTKEKILLGHRNQLRATQAALSLVIVLLLAFSLTAIFARPANVLAQSGGPEIKTDYMSVKTIRLADGRSIDQTIISGPPTPPAGYEAERAAVIVPNPSAAAKTLTDVPAYDWVMGCSAVSGSMIAAYYDRNGYPNIYTGSTNGGVMPMDNSVWGTWSDGYATYPNIPLAASHKGVDGRTTRGSIDDYWIKYGSMTTDPFITKGWTEHAWGEAIGDYMKTSQYNYGNSDGSTAFYTWNTDPGQLTCADMVSNGIQNQDGTYGRKLFYQARGYTVTDCYNQKTSNNGGNFTYAMYKAQIDANRPVMINLAGHTIVGVGYSDPNTIYVHDTWDYATHSMTWGGSYSGMAMHSVSIVNIKTSTPPPAGFNSQFNGSTTGWLAVKGAWKNYASMYYRSAGVANKFASAKHVNNYKNFTYQVRMKRTGTCITCANNIVIRGKANAFDASFAWKPSYLFQYTNNGNFSVWKVSNSKSTALKGWTASPFIVKKGWNTLKVIANGTSLKFYINNHLVWSGSDPALKTGQVGFGFYRDAAAGILDVDWAKLTVVAADELLFEEIVEQGAELPGGSVDRAP